MSCKALISTTEMNRSPEHLYRYRALDGDCLLYAERILLHNEIYLTSPSKVNDPFDCIVALDFDASDNDWGKFIVALSQRKKPHFAQNEHEEWAEDIIKNGRQNSEEFRSQTIAGLRHTVDSAGLLCLSERNDCILMWSHYANAHTGICLEFANDDSEPFVGRAQKVNYLPFYKKAHAIYDDSMAQIERILLSKAKCWAYEAEWRIIDHQTGHGLKYFAPTLLTGVILGHRISENHERLIIKWISARKSPVDVYKAKRSPDGFRIQICKL
jgi:DUF2971 family protein